METVLYIELNAFALMLLLLVYLNLRHPSRSHFAEQKLFLLLVFADALILVLDAGMWAMDGVQGLRALNLAASALYYAANPLPCLAWLLYVDYQVNRDKTRIRRLFAPAAIPLAANAVLACMSLFGDYLFYIDGDNHYHRGRLYLLTVLICYAYFAHALAYPAVHGGKLGREKLLPILLFPIPPFLGSLIQNTFYGVSLIWVCVTLSILIVFFNIQNAELYTDHLTGLYNRRQLDYYIHEKLKNWGNSLAGIMLDIDDFKRINDVYGHEAGDLALEQTARILVETFRRDDFIARYGGDEFMVILRLRDSLDLLSAIGRLNENVRQFNARGIFPFEISLSVGYDYFNYKPGATMEEFFRHIDRLMYEDKLSRKSEVEV